MDGWMDLYSPKERRLKVTFNIENNVTATAREI